ncbi:MAG: BTAD domain-containing putative transcriptional regulator [Pseudonocardiales bacterium]
MEFRVLGPMEVSEGGRLLDIGSRMPRAILAALLVEANRVVSLDRLIDQLWGEVPPAKATGALQVYISNLRRVLEPARRSGTSPRVLVTRAPGYLLRVETDCVDVARFEGLAVEGRGLLRAGKPLAARDVLREGLALWRGEPYAELAFEPFIQPEIARLTELRAGAGEALLEAELVLGEHAGVVAELERLVLADPLRERRWELLALALYRCGRQAEALRAVAKARRTLGEELGLDLGVALRQLENDILRQSPLLDWQPPAAGPAAPVEPSPSTSADPVASDGDLLVGRHQELSQLLEVLRQTREGRGGVALLAGEPGIGKTRLAEELSGRAIVQGALVAWGRCHEGEGAPAFWPWMQIVRTVADRLAPDVFRSALGPGAAEIAQIVPEIKEAFTDLQPVIAAFDPTTARTSLYDALSRFLLRVATARPLVLILDDLHWADPPSVELFGFLAGQLATAPVAVVGTYRGGEVPEAHPLTAVLANLARRPNVSRIALNGLDQSDVARLLTLPTGKGPNGKGPSDDLIHAVWDRTEGNPFFVAELVRLLETQGSLGREVPGRVRDVIRRRVALLPEQSARLLSVASVLGRDFDLDVLAGVGGYDIDGVLELVEAALVAHLLLEIPGAVGCYRFSHALVRDTLYDGLSALRRARLHHRVAETLAARDLADPVELAHHYWQAAAAGGAPSALMWAQRAAEQALSRLAYEQTEELLNRALQLIERLPAGAERDRHELDIQGRFWQLLAMTKGRGASEVGQVAARAVELGRQLGDAQLLAPALYRLASFHGSRAEPAVSMQLSEQLLELAEQSGDPVIRLLGHISYGYAALARGRLAEARDHLQRAMDLPDLLQDASLIPLFGRHPAVGCWSSLGIVLGLMGAEDRAKELMERAITLARKVGHLFNLALALHYDAWLAVLRRDIVHVRERAEETMAVCRKGGFLMWEVSATTFHGWARAQAGETASGVASMVRGLAEYRATGARRHHHFCLVLLSEAYLLDGSPEAAFSALNESLAESGLTGECYYEAELHRLQGETLAQLSPDRAAEAESALRNAVAVARAQGAVLLERRAMASLEAFLRSGGAAVDPPAGSG